MCLFGVAEYNTQPDAGEYQLWYEIGDIFVSFNRDAGPNGQTQECGDQVVIHRSPIRSPQGVEDSSDLLECLQEGEDYVGDGFTVSLNDIDTSIEPGCARISILVEPTQAPTPSPGSPEPTLSPEPTAFPTTETYMIEYFIDNFDNDDGVTIVIIGSCGNEVSRREISANRGGTGQFTSSLEDQYRFLIIDDGGNGGAKYTISYRGVLQVENDDWNTAEACHVIGDPPPLCDGIACDNVTPTSSPMDPSAAPVGPTLSPNQPTLPPNQPTNPTERPTQSPNSPPTFPPSEEQPTQSPNSPPTLPPLSASSDEDTFGDSVEIPVNQSLLGRNGGVWKNFYAHNRGGGDQVGNRRDSGRRQRKRFLKSRDID